MTRITIVKTPSSPWTVVINGVEHEVGSLAWCKEHTRRHYRNADEPKNLVMAHLRNGAPDLCHTVKDDS